MRRVLIVDDDPEFLTYTKTVCQAGGWECRCAKDKDEALRLASVERFDAALVDIDLAGRDGTALCAELRRGSLNPALRLLLTTAGEDRRHEVRSLAVADDFIAKVPGRNPRPGGTAIDAGVLLARLAKRAENGADGGVVPARLRAGPIEVDVISRQAFRDGRPLSSALGPRAFDLLAYLVLNAGRIVSKKELLERVWRDNDLNSNVVEKEISRLRRSLGDPEGVLLRTAPGHGYIIDRDPAPQDPAPRKPS